MEPNVSLTDRQTYLGIEMTWSGRYTSRIRIGKKKKLSKFYLQIQLSSLFGVG